MGITLTLGVAARMFERATLSPPCSHNTNSLESSDFCRYLYYYNTTTGVSQYEVPKATAAPLAPQMPSYQQPLTQAYGAAGAQQYQQPLATNNYGGAAGGSLYGGLAQNGRSGGGRGGGRGGGGGGKFGLM